MFGGYGVIEDGGIGMLGDTWRWDGSSWTRLDVPGPLPRTTMGGAALEGAVVLFGGAVALEDGGGALVGDTWRFDGSAWDQLPVTGPSGREFVQMGSLDDQVVFFGGYDENGNGNNDLWIWDGGAWAEAEINTFGEPNVPTQEVLLGVTPYEGQLFFTNGGFAWDWSGTAWSSVLDGGELPGFGFGATRCFQSSDCPNNLCDFTTGTCEPGGDVEGGVVTTVGDTVLLVGGVAGNSLALPQDYSGAWTWNGSLWSPAGAVDAGPPLRSEAGLATLGSTGYLFGGSQLNQTDGGFVYFGDTWAWDGQAWTRLDVAGPSARGGHLMVAY